MIALKLALVSALTLAGLTGPFTLDGNTWCPSYQAQYGCERTQSPSQYSVSFAASQVTLHGSAANLTMNSAAGASGAFNDNTYGSEYISDDEQVWANINVPCDSAGDVENWPAFWLDGTKGGWPAHGEIDIAEGLGGHMWWHYWFLNSSGVKESVGGEYTGDDCGSQWYSVNRTPDELYFYLASKLAGTVIGGDGTGGIGVPLATDPMYAIFDYAAGKWGGPTTNGAVMAVSGYGTSKG
jgi:hypothetical protein